MIAPLINAVPVRVKVDPKQSVDDLLNAIQRQSIVMIAYEQTELLHIRRINTDTERGSRFNTLLVVQPAGHGNYSDHGDGPFQHQLEMTSSRNGLDDFNPNAVMIMCQLKDTDGLGLEISFDSKVIDLAQMKRLVSQFEHILRQICASSAQTVEAIDTISAQDISELWQWNASLPCAVQECVHDLIGNMIRRQPQEPAICAWDGDLTYAQLDDFSSRLASHLVTLGAAPGTTIPLCFEKSMWHPVAALGAMKTGAACVAMDMTQPESRLRSIIRQLDPRFLLSSVNNEALARRLCDADVVILDQTHVMKLAKSLGEIPLPKVRASDVLYGS
jgi:non-ribosomal peptide synthetase component F